MKFLAINQHANHITIVICNIEGEDVLKRQVSTRSEKTDEFFSQAVGLDADFVAIPKTCGFKDWLIEELSLPVINAISKHMCTPICCYEEFNPLAIEESSLSTPQGFDSRSTVCRVF